MVSKTKQKPSQTNKKSTPPATTKHKKVSQLGKKSNKVINSKSGKTTKKKPASKSLKIHYPPDGNDDGSILDEMENELNAYFSEFEEEKTNESVTTKPFQRQETAPDDGTDSLDEMERELNNYFVENQESSNYAIAVKGTHIHVDKLDQSSAEPDTSDTDVDFLEELEKELNTHFQEQQFDNTMIIGPHLNTPHSCDVDVSSNNNFAGEIEKSEKISEKSDGVDNNSDGDSLFGNSDENNGNQEAAVKSLSLMGQASQFPETSNGLVLPGKTASSTATSGNPIDFIALCLPGRKAAPSSNIKPKEISSQCDKDGTISSTPLSDIARSVIAKSAPLIKSKKKKKKRPPQSIFMTRPHSKMKGNTLNTNMKGKLCTFSSREMLLQQVEREEMESIRNVAVDNGNDTDLDHTIYDDDVMNDNETENPEPVPKLALPTTQVMLDKFQDVESIEPSKPKRKKPGPKPKPKTGLEVVVVKRRYSKRLKKRVVISE